MNDIIDPRGGLRRRHGDNNVNDEAQPQPHFQRAAAQPARPRTRRARNENGDTHLPGMLHIKLSHVYCFTSTILAILAIIAATPMFLEVEPSTNVPSAYKTPSQWTNMETVARAAVASVAAEKGKNAEPETRDLLQSIQQWWNTHAQVADAEYRHPKENPSFWSLRFGKPPPTTKNSLSKNKKNGFHFKHFLQEQRSLRWIDPSIMNPSMTTPTDIIDKILTSTPRLLAIANFLLAMTYLLHSAVAAWFLGPLQRQEHHQQSPHLANQQGLVVDWSTSAGARERMGGFLVFKLLLISAVVAPDTLDLLILLTWYTMLSCLRSLDHLANATTTHLAALGQSPRSGVVQLLMLVLVCNILAAASCVALFHAAGWGMVLLLTCDCALLAADVLSHILKHVQCVLDDRHSQTIQSLEIRQLELHSGNVGAETEWVAPSSDNNVTEAANAESDIDTTMVGDEEAEPMSAFVVQEESRQLDRQMEVLDLAHARRLAILDTVEFVLEMLCHLLTVSHFLHLWSLHGVQFTLIDGVLALHLHSAISSGCKKVAERRNIHSIARDLQGLFANATEQELRKASSTGDVCCICLNTMSSGGHVIKVHCGHLYHTHCLREVIERAQSIQAAKCPLCRASILDGRRPGETNSAITRNIQPPQDQAAPATMDPVQPQAQPIVAGEHALFRFSTEGFVPAWLPVPAFSFEVVRRPSAQPQSPTPGTEPQQAQGEGDFDPTNEVAAENIDESPRLVERIQAPAVQAQQQHDGGQQSFLRRFLVLAGAIPMSPEEEARAIAQLVDMFPQYDRGDLLREVRARGSAEAVAEAILMGIFSGVPRGD
jgi:hypothetical protein